MAAAGRVAALLLTFWAAAGLVELGQPAPTVPAAHRAAQEPQIKRAGWVHPDPRTLGRFPGP